MVAGRRRLFVLVVVVAAVAFSGAAAAWSSADADPVEVTATVAPADPALTIVEGTWNTTTTTTTTAPAAPLDPASGLGIAEPLGPPWPTEFTVADALAAEVELYETPGVRVPTMRTMPNPTREGYRLVLLVMEERGDWLHVQINERPNGATAWVRRDQVELRTVPNHILVERGAKRLTVFHGDEAIYSTSMAPGKASTPTPLGNFYVDIVTRPDNQNGPYGLYQISVTGFSEVYDSFGGGNGQIAIHGTNRPELIGTPASNGCVRLSNTDITTLVSLARQGTPVQIVA